MKKTGLSLVCIIMLFAFASAQKEEFSRDVKVGIGATIGLPTGTYKQIESELYEVGILAEFPASKMVNVTGNVAYFSATGKNGVKIDGGAIPVLVGAKIFFAKNVYGHVQVGASFPTESGGTTAFTYSPSLGYQFFKHVDFSVRYFAGTNNKVTESYVGLRAGLTF